jgi:hypothetical protein
MPMAAFLYSCPNTGRVVQGWIEGDLSTGDQATYETVTCIACEQVHLVQPKTGKVIGARDDGQLGHTPFGRCD